MLPNAMSIAYNRVVHPNIAGDAMEENELSVSAAAKKIKVSVSTLARAARKGQLKARKLGIGNAWVTTLDDANEWKKNFYKPHQIRR